MKRLPDGLTVNEQPHAVKKPMGTPKFITVWGMGSICAPAINPIMCPSPVTPMLGSALPLVA